MKALIWLSVCLASYSCGTAMAKTPPVVAPAVVIAPPIGSRDLPWLLDDVSDDDIVCVDTWSIDPFHNYACISIRRLRTYIITARKL